MVVRGVTTIEAEEALASLLFPVPRAQFSTMKVFITLVLCVENSLNTSYISTWWLKAFFRVHDAKLKQ